MDARHLNAIVELYCACKGVIRRGGHGFEVSAEERDAVHLLMPHCSKWWDENADAMIVANG